MTTVLLHERRFNWPRRRPSAWLFDREILAQALKDSIKKLDPRVQLRNPVMFVVLVGSIIIFSSPSRTRARSRGRSRFGSS